MERGVKLAMVVAAVACIAAALTWDRVIRTVVELPTNAITSDAADSDSPAPDPTSRMEFHFVGAPAIVAEAPASANAGGSNGTAAPVSEAVSASPSSSAAAGNGASSSSPSSRDRVYTVRSGDQLVSISKKMYGTQRYWHEIMTYNNIKDPKSLRLNQVLRIPPIETLGDR
ncbi:MAG: LysM peptidoglycan-binding domain-containing protein [Planctomycetota bacterium]